MQSVIRIDNAQIENSTFVTGDGALLAPATFAKDGVLIYQTQFGKRRELRPPETNKKAIAEFGLTPITLEHPKKFIDENSPPSARLGITLPQPKYEFVPGKGGFVSGSIAVWGREIRDAIESGEAVEISSAYKCDTLEEPGVWVAPDGSKHPYDAVQTNLRINHHAVTRRGRAGHDARIHLDSATQDYENVGILINDDEKTDSQEEVPEMDGLIKLNIGDAQIEVSPTQYQVLGPFKQRYDSALQELQDAKRNLGSALAVEDQLEYERGRNDGLDARLANAEDILEQFGYFYADNFQYRHDGSTPRADMNHKGKGVEVMEEDDEEDMPMAKGKKKEDMGYKKTDGGDGKKEDGSDEEREDADLVWATLSEISEVDPAFISDRLDSIAQATTPSQIQRIAVGTWREQLAYVDEETGQSRLDSMDDYAVNRVYAILYQDVANNPDNYVRTDASDEEDGDDTRQDSEWTDSGHVPGEIDSERFDYSDELQQAMNLAGGGSSDQAHQDSNEFSDAYLQPLALSLDS